MSARASVAERSPVSIDLKGLIALKPGGEAIRLTAPRVRAFAAGGNLSPFKGRGVEFDESRPYQAGDDLRTMDWRVTARTGKPYTKVFREERNRPVIVWLDLRRSMLFATRRAYKAVAAAELAGLIAWSAVGHGDQLGGLVFTENEHHEQRPRLGGRSALRLLQLIVASSCWTEELMLRPARADDPSSAEADADRALLRLTRVVRPGSMLFLISDFQGLSGDFERHIRELASHGDVFLVHVFDPVEAELPPPGRYRIQLGSRSFTIETADARNRERHRERFKARRERLRTLAAAPGVALIECATADDPHEVLSKRFARA
jgi:uncharacterized protein (DUF58 family)